MCFTIIGRVTDIFGRRWVFVGGAALGIIGSIVCATAHSVGAFIGGMTIIGIAASTQLSYFYVMGEIVPMKYRLIGNAWCYAFTLPGSGISPTIVQALVQNYPSVGWRGGYYILIGTNTLSFLCWFFFYHPPTFKMKHGQRASVMKYLKNFDYVGTFLYTGGLLVIMMGLNWGGTVYPWGSANVIATIVAGAAGLAAFFLWESFADLKEPLVPMELFKNVPWTAATILSGLGASVYYAMAIVWPAMVTAVYGDAADAMTNSVLASLMGLGICLGEVIGGSVAKKLGYIKWQCVGMVILSGVFIAATASSTPDTKVRASVFVFIGTIAVGWAESLAITTVTLTIWDQTRLGSASGLAGSIRFFISCISSTIYNIVLNNRMKTTVSTIVPKALVEAGLPTSSVPKFMADLAIGSSFTDVPGITNQIIAIGVRANKVAYANAYSTVFLTSIAFTGIALISALMLPDVDALLSSKVASTLHKGRDQNKLVGEA